MPAERTFVLLKPDAVQRGLTFEVSERFEKRGLTLAACRMQQPPQGTLEKHCEALKGSAGYDAYLAFLAAGPVVAQVWEGADAVAAAVATVGDADPVRAANGTIRGDLAVDPARNLVDCAASKAEAARSIALWFKPEELVSVAAPGPSAPAAQAKVSGAAKAMAAKAAAPAAPEASAEGEAAGASTEGMSKRAAAKEAKKAEKAAASEKAAAAERERAAAEEAARGKARGGAAEEEDDPRERRRKRRNGGGGGGGSSPLSYLPMVLVAALTLAVLPVVVSKVRQRRMAAVKPSADEVGGTPLGAYGGIGTPSVLSDVGSPTPTARRGASTPSLLLGKLMSVLRPGPRQPAEGVETNADVAKFTMGGGGFGPMANANVNFSVDFDDDLEGSTTNSLKGSNLSDDEFDVGGFSAAEDGRTRNPTPPAFEGAFESAPALPFPGAAAIPQSRSRGSCGSASGSFGSLSGLPDESAGLFRSPSGGAVAQAAAWAAAEAGSGGGS